MKLTSNSQQGRILLNLLSLLIYLNPAFNRLIELLSVLLPLTFNETKSKKELQQINGLE
jgi:hypothetical protein